MSEVKPVNGVVVLSDDPTKIPDEVIKKYMVKHRAPAIDAFKDILSQDLLDRVKKLRCENDIKIILKILVQQVVGNGMKS